MSSVQDIESAIRGLSRDDLADLRVWLAEFDADAWDRQIAEDAQSGKLDAFYQSLQRENEGQPDVTLHDFVHQTELP